MSYLIENAIKFSTDGKIQFGYEEGIKFLKFYVKDTGMGIKKKDLTSIFEKFRQVDSEMNTLNSGTGLGLSISNELVKMMKGDIWVESEFGKGSTFYFTIPHISENALMKNDSEIKVITNNRERTILIAEDDEMNLFYLKALLRKFNFNILHAENGKHAVDMVNDNLDIELILMEIRMPVMDGLLAVSEIRNSNKKVPIIAQTAYTFEEERQKSMDVGCNDYISKPLSKKDIERIVEKHLLVA